MNIKRLLAVLLALCMMVALCACGQTQEPSQTPDAPVADDQPTQQPSENEQPSEEAPVQNTNPTYTVKIVDEGGNPVVGAMVQMCQGETCMPGPLSDATGTVIFQIPEAEYKVSFLGSVPAGYDYTTEETEFYFEDGSYEMTIVLKAVG